MTDKKKKLTELYVREVVEEFLKHEGIHLRPQVVGQLVVVTRAVWRRSNEAWTVRDIHRAIKLPGEDGGVYRGENVVLAIKKESVHFLAGDNISFQHIPKAVSVWYTWYAFVLRSMSEDLEYHCKKFDATPERFIEGMGIALRAIKPFRNGNRIISWILENQLRLHLGLDLRRGLPDKDWFNKLRPACLAKIESTIRLETR